MSGASYFSPVVAQRGVGSQWDALIRATADQTGVDPSLIKAVISAESAWDPLAVSFNSSSYGIMQLNLRANNVTEAQAFDPGFAIPFGAQMLAAQLGRRPTLDLAIAAYNAGTSRTDADLQARINANTLGVGGYVRTVEDFLAWFQQNDAPVLGTGATPPGTSQPTDVVVDPNAPAPDDAGSIGLDLAAGGGLVILVAAVAFFLARR